MERERCILFKLSEVPCILWKRTLVCKREAGPPKAQRKKMSTSLPCSSSRWEPVTQKLSMWSQELDYVIDKQSRRKAGRT